MGRPPAKFQRSVVTVYLRPEQKEVVDTLSKVLNVSAGSVLEMAFTAWVNALDEQSRKK